MPRGFLTGAMSMSGQHAVMLGVLAASLVGSASAFSLSAAPVLRRAALSSASHSGGLRSPLAARSSLRGHARAGVLSLRAEGEWGRMERVAVSGNEISYTVTTEGEEVGVIQATKPLTPEKPFYEVTIVDGGTQSWIGVGLADVTYALDKQPGWDQASIGYHADDGMLYRAPIPDEMSKSGRPAPMPLTGKPFPVSTGDKIGVGVEFDKMGKEASQNPRRVFFSKNGVYLGSVLVERQYSAAMFPTVGFNSPGAKATVDFDASGASVELVHAAQFFGTNNYALDIAIEEIGKGADLNVQVCTAPPPLSQPLSPKTTLNPTPWTPHTLNPQPLH